MKLAQHHRRQNPRHNIVFAKGEDDPKIHDYAWDRIYITTLFSFEWRRTASCIDAASRIVYGQHHKIFVGGIAVSLMFEQFNEVECWKGIRFIQGILKGMPDQALQLKEQDFDFNHNSFEPIDELSPDYSILEQCDYKYPVNDAYFGYASRGCVRKCAFCGVPKLEGEQQIMPPITGLVESIDKIYGAKKDLILMDNNVTAAPNFHNIIAEIRDLGFTPGAKLRRESSLRKRRVDFNQGVDARLLAKNPALLKDISTICIDPLRIAFDHLGVKKVYERSVRDAAENGITSLSNYMLYNFYDDPADLYHRMLLNIKLNIELGIRIWSFPMRYQPVDFKDRSHVGKKWNRFYLRSFQIILQSTRGVVAGGPDFFNIAFGSSLQEFEELLSLPHQFIFNRKHFFHGEGRPLLDEFRKDYARLSPSQKTELMHLLSGGSSATSLKTTGWIDFIQNNTIDHQIRNLIRYYISYKKTERVNPENLFSHLDLHVPAEKRIEDAGLYDSNETDFFGVLSPAAT